MTDYVTRTLNDVKRVLEFDESEMNLSSDRWKLLEYIRGYLND